MKNLALFLIILLSVLSSFVVLGITENYFYWFLSVIISTIIWGTIFRIVICIFQKKSNKTKKESEITEESHEKWQKRRQANYKNQRCRGIPCVNLNYNPPFHRGDKGMWQENRPLVTQVSGIRGQQNRPLVTWAVYGRISPTTAAYDLYVKVFE